MALPFPRGTKGEDLYTWGRQLVTELTSILAGISPEPAGVMKAWTGTEATIPAGWIKLDPPADPFLTGSPFWIVKS